MISELVIERPEFTSATACEFSPQPSVDSAGPAIRRMDRYAELTGFSMFCLDVSTGTVLAKSDAETLTLVPGELARQLSTVERVRVIELPSGLTFFAIGLPTIDRSRTVAAGYVLSRPDVRPDNLEIVLAAAEHGWPQERFERWFSQLGSCSRVVLERLLNLAFDEVEHQSVEATLQGEIDELFEQIEHTYEEISLLHELTHNLQISRTPSQLAEICITRIHDIVKSAGNVIWIEERNDVPLSFVKGKLPFDELGMSRLISHFEDSDWSRPLVKNHIQGTLLGADFPGLENFVIVPVAEGTHRTGWILSCNLPDRREFGTIEASLLNSVATILGTHVRNIDLYQQHGDLLLAFVRSLVSTLDAKDPYTRGHSERVALVGRRLGEEFKLPDDDLHDIYLSGLLHDVGKIGVDDRILQKPGKLTDEEFKQIQRHPMIGYSILKGLKNLHKVLPGVRHHHESYNGRGYPDGLMGEEIPLMARILAVADSYDAMGSDRPYRKGMPLEKIEEIFRRGSGNQWDEKVIDAYFTAHDDIREICESYSLTASGVLEDGFRSRTA